ncbi:MAG: hypothetical protein OXT09_36110 [Myxococcales bacterium]|nr:hypothetical protein [Myxococcales bacterium]
MKWLCEARATALAVLWCVSCAGGDVSSGARERALFDGGQATAEDECPLEQETFPCTCLGGEPGRSVCMDGQLSECECAPEAAATASGDEVPADTEAMDALAGNRRSDITFDWTRTEPDGLTCEPGHYEGSFAGSYFSRLNWPVPFPVIGVDLPGFPGLQFDMLPAEPGEVTLAVDGKFDGLADGLFPFRGDFVGELNCETGEFTGMMINAEYTIGPDQLVILENPVRFQFEGPVWATYDKLTHSFVGGIWDAVEPQFGGMPFQTYPRDPLRDGVGGSGVWSAGWINDDVEYTCPAMDANGLPLACQPGPFGLTKTFCVYPALLPGARADGPTCVTDADCEAHFPGEEVRCTDVNGDGVYIRCLKECAP